MDTKEFARNYKLVVEFAKTGKIPITQRRAKNLRPGQTVYLIPSKYTRDYWESYLVGKELVASYRVLKDYWIVRVPGTIGTISCHINQLSFEPPWNL